MVTVQRSGITCERSDTAATKLSEALKKHCYGTTDHDRSIRIFVNAMAETKQQLDRKTDRFVAAQRGAHYGLGVATLNKAERYKNLDQKIENAAELLLRDQDTALLTCTLYTTLRLSREIACGGDEKPIAELYKAAKAVLITEVGDAKV